MHSTASIVEGVLPRRWDHFGSCHWAPRRYLLNSLKCFTALWFLVLTWPFLGSWGVLEMIVGRSAPSCFNMSPYRSIWSHFRSNSMIFLKKMSWTWSWTRSCTRSWARSWARSWKMSNVSSQSQHMTNRHGWFCFTVFPFVSGPWEKWPAMGLGSYFSG